MLRKLLQRFPLPEIIHHQTLVLAGADVERACNAAAACR